MGIFHFCPLEKLKITRIEVEAYQEVSLYLHVLTLHMCCSLQGSKLTFQCTCKVLLERFFFYQQTGETTSKFFPFVWETWMIPTRKRLLVDVFLTCRLSKSIACCEFASVNFLALVQGAFHLSELTGQTIRAVMRNSLLIITIQLDQLNFKQQA